MAAGFFDSASLPNHSHSAVVGDGGQLTNPTITGTVTVTQEPSANLQLSTVEMMLAAALLGG